MAKQKGGGILEVFGEILDSAVDVVNGNIFGEEHGDPKRKHGSEKERVDDGISGGDEPPITPKPEREESTVKKLKRAFTPTDAPKKKGPAAGVDESAEDDSTGEPKATE